MSSGEETATSGGIAAHAGRPQVLLHVCCGPCAIVPVLRLREEGFAVTGYFMNPNIQPLAEYLRRREAMEQCAARLELPMLWQDDAWDLTRWLRDVAGTRDEGEPRCRYCYRTRLEAAHKVARQYGFPLFTSSLLYSRYQRHAVIAEIAETAAATKEPAFLYRDFRPGWQEGIDLSKEWELYRQPYCGCVYSEAERYAKSLAKKKS